LAVQCALTPENLKGSSGGMVRIDPYSFNRSVQRRDGSASQLNWRAVTLFAVLTPPAIVRHLLVGTFLICSLAGAPTPTRMRGDPCP
jgi:hypothetical protein